MMRRAFAFTLLFAATLGTGCTVGPDYVRPSAPVPQTFKEAGKWKPAEPRDDSGRGPWWEVFGDAQLNALVERVNVSNQNILAAEAQFRGAQALVQQARAGYFPTLSMGVSTVRSQSPNLPNAPSTTRPVTTYNLPANASWEPDLWGSVRRAVESSEANAQSTAASLESARLSAQATLAQNYFLLRTADAQKRLLDDTAAAYERSLELTKNRYAAGVAARVDVVQALTQLKSTQAQAIEIGVQRAALEHAIAVLMGEPPEEFSIAPTPLDVAPPAIPVGVPSELLERRPDIAAAERSVAAANAQIGVAIAAFYPTLTLSAAGGFRSTDAADWLSVPSRYWSVGAALAQVLFDGGLRSGVTAQARATYDSNVAAYRQTVLTGFQEVEDNLAALRILEEEAAVQADAVAAARQSVDLTTNQYKAGIVSYLNVVAVQTVALNNERTAVGILGQRLTASVLLVKALGGGWDASALAGTARAESATRTANAAP
ncbi:MAG: efflux transporter outer membrane subunit [Betaproteobacteria bacterium]|nr:efflux transporter outer membrane subunit [Betaproteobacteria bacterium]